MAVRHTPTLADLLEMLQQRTRTAIREESSGNIGLLGYLLFVVSWFLHLPARVPFLGKLRLDLLLVLALTVIAVLNAKSAPHNDLKNNPTDKLLRVLIGYAVLTIPFVEWPGSVVKIGLPEFIKAAVFYYFTIAFIRTEKELRLFILVFLACQTIRVLEPLYLHLTEGYWGSKASMGGGYEYLYRLSGGPFDVVNPNGLAFVICTLLSFLYFLSQISWKHKAALILIAPPALYALALTGSRSGLIALAIVGIGILIKSKHRAALAATFCVVAIVGFSMLDSNMQDRYLSTFGMGEKNADTANERYEGAMEQFKVILHRPIFGHGLGTSAEANYHFTSAGPYGGRDIPAHNLYLETAQELGIIGVIIFTLFIKSILTGFIQAQKVQWPERLGAFMPRLIDSMQVWLAMSFVFSFASYGLSNYDWYLFAGLSVITQRFARQYASEAPQPASATQLAPRGMWGFRAARQPRLRRKLSP